MKLINLPINKLRSFFQTKQNYSELGSKRYINNFFLNKISF